jgi:ABC-type multidrug transport system fused ATPase/permease subunit
LALWVAQVDSAQLSPPQCVCVGFTAAAGSGKSSLTLMLFRIIESELGQILLDGVT